MKSLFTVVSILALSLGAFAQTSSDWTLIQTKNGVKIYQKDEVCKHEVGTIMKSRIFKFENTTNTVKNVSFRMGAYYGTDDCATCNNSEYDRKFAIAPNSSIEGACFDPNLDKYTIFIRYENEKNYRPDLSKFEFSNLIVK